MAGVFKTCAVSVSVSALLLAAALLTGAGADDVTTERCRKYGRNHRVRQYPADDNATTLWMYECHITDVNYDDLANLPNVEKIVLFSNVIAHINLTVFRSVPKLTKLILFSIKLSELPVFGEHSCPSLTELFLSYNLLTDISNWKTFSACSKLETLYMTNNNIVYIHPDTFSVLTELRVLFLHNNKITYIAEDMFTRNSKLRQLELFNNRLTYLPPDFMVNLKRAGISIILFAFYGNPWQCACLVEALVDVKRAGVDGYKRSIYDTSKVIHYEGSMPECVYVGAVSCRRAGLLRRPAPRVAGGGR